jgi:hypothetical protein
MKHRLIAAAAVVCPLLAACYTVNIYNLDGSGGAGGSGTDASSSASNGSSDATTGTASSTGSGFCPMMSGFADAKTEVPAMGCPFVTGPLDLMNSSSFDGSWCRLHHASEQAPFIMNNELNLDTACSEWTPHGFGPFVYQSLVAPAQDFAVWATFRFQTAPEKNYQGAGVIFRWGPLAEPQQYAIADVFRHPNQGGTPTVSLWHDVGGNPMQESPSAFPGGYDDVRIGLCARMNGATTPNTHVITGYYRIPAGSFMPIGQFEADLSGVTSVDVGFGAHALGGGDLEPRVTSAGLAKRLASPDPCFDGQLGPIN